MEIFETLIQKNDADRLESAVGAIVVCGDVNIERISISVCGTTN